MIISNKRFNEIINRQYDMWKRMREYDAKIEKLSAELAEAKKRTVADMTTEKDAPVTPKQIINEWFNGGDKQ